MTTSPPTSPRIPRSTNVWQAPATAETPSDVCDTKDVLKPVAPPVKVETAPAASAATDPEVIPDSKPPLAPVPQFVCSGHHAAEESKQLSSNAKIDIGDHVLVIARRCRGEHGIVTASGHGFFSVDIGGREVMKRAHELELCRKHRSNEQHPAPSAGNHLQPSRSSSRPSCPRRLSSDAASSEDLAAYTRRVPALYASTSAPKINIGDHVQIIARRFCGERGVVTGMGHGFYAVDIRGNEVMKRAVELELLPDAADRSDMMSRSSSASPSRPMKHHSSSMDEDDEREHKVAKMSEEDSREVSNLAAILVQMKTGHYLDPLWPPRPSAAVPKPSGALLKPSPQPASAVPPTAFHSPAGAEVVPPAAGTASVAPSSSTVTAAQPDAEAMQTNNLAST